MIKNNYFNWMEYNGTKHKRRIERYLFLTIVSRRRWLPSSALGRLEWLKNFTEVLPTYQAVFGITVAQMTSVNNDYLMFKWIMETEMNLEEKWHEFVAYKNYLNNGAPADVSLGDVPVVDLPPAPRPQ